MLALGLLMLSCFDLGLMSFFDWTCEPQYGPEIGCGLMRLCFGWCILILWTWCTDTKLLAMLFWLVHLMNLWCNDTVGPKLMKSWRIVLVLLSFYSRNMQRRWHVQLLKNVVFRWICYWFRRPWYFLVLSSVVLPKIMCCSRALLAVSFLLTAEYYI